MRKTILISFLFIFCLTTIYAQGKNKISRELLENRMLTQLNIYPQEKIHLHTDRNNYVPGEKIWFKAYLTDATTLREETNSRYVYVELINPLDSVVKRVMIHPINNMYHGHISIPDDLPEGLYTICSYTRYMGNMGKDHFFRSSVQIGNLLASQITPHCIFEYDEKEIYIDLHYTKGDAPSKIKPDNLQIRNARGQLQCVKIDKDTIARISFKLPLPEKMKVLYLEADNYHHYIPLPSINNDYDVSFFPEGGYLINNCFNQIAFKAINTTGKSENVEGELYNNKGELLNSMKTVHDGMGVFGLIPVPGEQYYVECTSEKLGKRRFSLPTAISDLPGLSVSILRNNIFVGLNKNTDNKISNDYYLLAQNMGSICYFEPWPKNNDHIGFSIDQLPAGIVQFILLDKNLNIISERLFFSNSNYENELQIKKDREAYKTREKVNLNLQISDEEGIYSSANMSIAITDDQDIAIDTTSTILSTLLLSSELKGHIESPAYYLKKEDNKVAYALDLLMMTHGWRRYDISRAIKGEYIYPQILPEQSHLLSGYVKKTLTKKPVVNGEITMMLTHPNGEFMIDQTITNEQGRFIFDRMEFPDSTTIFVQSLNEKGKDHVELQMDSIGYPTNESNRYYHLNEEIQNSEQITDDNFIKKAGQRALYDDDIRVIHLKEVDVVAKRIEKDQPKKSVYASMSTTIIDLEKKMETRHYMDLADVLMEVPGVQITQVYDSNTGRMVKYVIIRGISSFDNSFATIMMDGMTMEEGLDFINVHDVATIEVYKGADAAIFGSRGGGGVVNIITKTGSGGGSAPITYNKYTSSPLGHQIPVEFYSPKYETPQQKSSATPDMRTTIYWKPDILTDEQGKTSIEFYSADTPTTYSVIIEGLTTEGKIIRSVEKIKVE